MNAKFILKMLRRDALAFATWVGTVTLLVTMFDFYINAASVIAGLLLACLLSFNTAAYGLIKSRRARGLPAWGGFMGGLYYYLALNIIVIAMWFLVLALHPVYLNPFEPLAWQLPALQGYFTAIVAHCATLGALWIYDRNVVDS